MGKLFGENEQLAVRNFQVARGSFRRCTTLTDYFGFRAQHFDPDGNALLQFNLPDRDCSICAIEYPFNQTALGIPGAISKLWHRRGKLSGNLKSQTGIWLRQVYWTMERFNELRVTRLRSATARQAF